MTITSRSRSRTADTVTGRYYYNGSLADTLTSAMKTEFCDDVIGDYGNDHSFFKRTYGPRIPFVMNGTNGSYRFEDWHAFPGGIYPDPHPWDTSQLATSVAARTNPSRPHVLLPVFVFELRDVPDLIRLGGRRLLDRAAHANLFVQFGWRPFLQDLLKLMDFHDTFDRRTDEINRLVSGGGLRRRVSVGSYADTSTSGPTTICSYPFASLTTGKPTTVQTYKAWGTIRWRPSASILKMTDAERSSKLRRLLHGLDLSQITQNVWEGLPWSWLVDWCANVGDFLQASNNSISHIHGNINLMIYSEIKRTWEVTSKPSGVTLSPTKPEQMTSSKARYILPGPSLSASIPFLNGTQLSVLGSLSVLKGRR